MSNNIPHETKGFDNQNPPWMNAEIENLITPKMRFLKHIQKVIEIAIILTNIKR